MTPAEHGNAPLGSGAAPSQLNNHLPGLDLWSSEARDGTPRPGNGSAPEGEAEAGIGAWAGFPTLPKPECSMSMAVLQWAAEQGVEFRPPRDRSDVCRAVLTVGRRVLGERDKRWQRYCTQALLEHTSECLDDDELPQTMQVRRFMHRLVALYGSELVLRALTETLTRPIALDGDPFGLLRYTAAILRRWSIEF